MTTDQDFETVAYGLHYYGDTIPNDSETLKASDAALDRIKARLSRYEELEKVVGGFWDTADEHPLALHSSQADLWDAVCDALSAEEEA